MGAAKIGISGHVQYPGHVNAITYTAARENLASPMDKVCRDHDPIVITKWLKRGITISDSEAPRKSGSEAKQDVRRYTNFPHSTGRMEGRDGLRKQRVPRKKEAGGFTQSLRCSSVTRPAPFPRDTLPSRKITPALVDFDLLFGFRKGVGRFSGLGNSRCQT